MLMSWGIPRYINNIDLHHNMIIVWGGAQIRFGWGRATENPKPIPIFKGHFGRKGTFLYGFFFKNTLEFPIFP